MFFLHFEPIKLNIISSNQLELYFNTSIWILKWLEPFNFLLFKESNKISGTVLFGFSHQVMKLILFANPKRSRDLLYLEIVVIYDEKYL